MDWSDLAYALAVARARSVTGAARELGVAHTTVYRRLNALEESSGVRFFDRSGSHYTLTEAGRQLLEVGDDVERRIAAFERALRGQDQRLAGEVTLATVEPLAVELCRQLGAFQRRHPAIRVRLHVTSAFVTLGQDADIALRITRAPPESLVGRRLGDVAFAVFAAVGRLAGPLHEAGWVCFDDDLARSPQGRWEAAHIPPERVALRTNSRAVFREAVSGGTGVGILPCSLAAEDPHLLALTEVIPELSLPLWLLTHPDLAQMPRVRVLLDYLAETLGERRAVLEGRRLVQARQFSLADMRMDSPAPTA